MWKINIRTEIFNFATTLMIRLVGSAVEKKYSLADLFFPSYKSNLGYLRKHSGFWNKNVALCKDWNLHSAITISRQHFHIVGETTFTVHHVCIIPIYFASKPCVYWQLCPSLGLSAYKRHFPSRKEFSRVAQSEMVMIISFNIGWRSLLILHK